jgi:hypothetical protein
MEVACFFERYALYPRGKKTFVVLEESASLPGIDAQPIQANHETMCQTASLKMKIVKVTRVFRRAASVDLEFY